jgi:hypothetical protein
MTFEKTCFVSPEDIEAVQFKCTPCGSSISIPINKLLTGDLGIVATANCHYCRTPPSFVMGGSDLERLLTFTTILSELTQILKGKNLKLSFQVKCPEK